MASGRVTIVTAILLAVMIAVSGGVSFFTSNYATAQITGNMTNNIVRPGGMMGVNPGMIFGNHSNMMMEMTGASQNVTGSINLFSTISNAIETQVKVSLSEAMLTAEGAVK